MSLFRYKFHLIVLLIPHCSICHHLFQIYVITSYSIHYTKLYDVMVDDSHAVGFIGENGRGTAEYCGVEGRVDIITGTLGKALGGASGGYTSGKRRNNFV